MVSRFGRLAVAGALAAAGLASSAQPAHAEAIVGKFDFALGNVRVGLGFVDWYPSVDTPPSAVHTYGSFDVDPAPATRTGVFAHNDFSYPGCGPDSGGPVGNCGAPIGGGIGSNTPNGGGLAGILEPEKIQDMSNPAIFPGDANNVPIGASGGIANFFQFAERPNWNFTQTFLQPGITPQVPFLLTQNGDSVFASINVQGIAWDNATPTEITRWTAIISTTVSATTVETLAALLGSGGTLDQSWQGSFTAEAIPEPATMLTFGVGSLLAGAVRRRKAKKNQA